MLSSLNTLSPVNNISKRNSNIELLRILAMVMIVFSHCSMHDYYPDGPSRLPINNFILDWCILGNLGVDLFLLIAGYFLSLKTEPRKSALRLWAQMWTYSVGCTVLYLATGHFHRDYSIASVIFPTLWNTYWFFSAYIIFLLLTPYINLAIQNSTQKQLFSCILIMVLFWSVFPAITDISLYGDILPTFLMFYLIGAYFRKYPKNIFSNRTFRWLAVFPPSILLFLSSAVYRTWGSRLGNLARPVLFFYERNSILAVLSTVSIFAIFLYLPVFHSKIINWIGSCTFGIYLFHDNPLIRRILWPEWLPKYDYYHTNCLVPAILISVFIVMIAGTAIETIRKLFIEKPFLKVVSFFVRRIPGLHNLDT